MNSCAQRNAAFRVRGSIGFVLISPQSNFAFIFQNAVDAAKVMGERMRTRPPFREGSILKYKRYHANESAHNKFLESWPESIVLRSVEKSVAWNMKVTSKCCPFCAPAGRCRSLKELNDHLLTHHPEFTFKVRRNGGDGAIITVRFFPLVSMFSILTCLYSYYR